jgi:superfamily II DNA/RNA helicase
MPSQIIDNRRRKLVDEINVQLDATVRAKIAVGYFFLSGLKAIEKKLTARDEKGEYKIKEVKLLIGNTTNRETIEELARGYRLVDEIERRLEKLKRPGAGERKLEKENAVQEVRSIIGELDQNDENIRLVQTVYNMVVDGRLKVKVYIKTRLHAKAYIFDFLHPQPNSRGIAIVGSSNLSLAGLTHNTELNVYVHDNGENHAELTRWFNELWNEAEDFNDEMLEELQESWVVKKATPYDIYMKTIYTLLKDRLEGVDDKSFLWTNEVTEQLTTFQKNAVRQLIGIIKQYSGAFAADVVGVGKSYIGAAVIKHFTITEGCKPLIICPKSLEEMWKDYNAEYSLGAEIVPMSILREGNPDSDEWNFLFENIRYRDRDIILIDESHHFRHHSPQRYKILADFLQTGKKKVLLLTATPRNNSARDVYNQIKLFHPEDVTHIPVNPPNLKEYFKSILHPDTKREDANRMFQTLMQYIMVRRTRLHILKYYGYDSETNERVDPKNFDAYVSGEKRAYILVGGRPNYFPNRIVETVRYSISDTYQGLYERIRKRLGKHRFDYLGEPVKDELCYARFALWHYVKEDKQNEKPYSDLQRAGTNLRGLMRILLFKRFESSVYAFRMTIKRLVNIHKAFLTSIDNGVIPAGEEAQKILYGSDQYSEEDLITALRDVAKQYYADDFDIDRLRKHIVHDKSILEEILEMVNEEKIPPSKDAKLKTLIKILKKKPLNQGKVLIFSESAETVDYLYKNINPENDPTIRKASTTTENKASLVKRFSPKANNYTFKKGEIEIQKVVSTDVLSEGLNMQDCDKIINYDLHWNPVKLIQRFGRIDRIGSEFDEIFGFNFLPETELDKNLNLHEVVHNRIQEIHDTIGEDAIILDESEQLNHEAMYAIYEREMKQLALFEEKMDKDSISFNEAEEELRNLQNDNPDEYERIINLRDGIRAVSTEKGNRYFVFCQADRYNQLYLVNEKGEILNREVTEILAMLKNQINKTAKPIPKVLNSVVTKVKKQFIDEVVNRYLEQKHTVSLTTAQKYLLKELQVLYNSAKDEDLKAQIEAFQTVFQRVNRIAIHSELNKIKNNKMTGMPLLKKLSEMFSRHNLFEVLHATSHVDEKPPVPKVICSEIL